MKKTLHLTMTLNDRGRGVFMDEEMENKINADELARLIKEQHRMKKGDTLCIKIISANLKYEPIEFSMEKLNDIVTQKTAGGIMTTNGLEVQILKTDMKGCGPLLGVVNEKGLDVPVFWNEDGKSNDPEHGDGRYDLILFLEKDAN